MRRINDRFTFEVATIYIFGFMQVDLYTSLFTKDGSVNRKEKYTYKK